MTTKEKTFAQILAIILPLIGLFLLSNDFLFAFGITLVINIFVSIMWLKEIEPTKEELKAWQDSQQWRK